MGIKLLHSILCLGCCLLISCSSAQQLDTVIKEGQSYYVYAVAPGNTLYAIARQYSVPVQALLTANPGSDRSLQVGQQILIPIDAIDRREERRNEVVVQGSFLEHTVQRKETLFSISRSYGVSLDTLYSLNPEAALRLRQGMRIKIPIVASESIERRYLKPAASDSFMVHQVSSGDTPYAIAKKYDVELAALRGANPSMQMGIQPGQWLTIPRYKSDISRQLQAESKLPVDSSMYPTETKESYNLGLMLPFELHRNDSLLHNLQAGNDLYLLTEIALEYYRGARLALDSLRKLGLSATVYVYDVGEDPVDARQVMKRPEIQKLDVLFGPLHKASLAVVSDMSRPFGTYMISPNSFSNEVFEDNPYLIRAWPSRETVMRYLGNYVAIQHQDDNVLMVNSERSSDWPYRKLFKQSYNAALGTFPNVFRDSLSSISKGNLRPESLIPFLRKDTLNVLVVPSTELAFVSDFMTKLSRIDTDYRVQVYGLDTWLRYDNIDSAYKNRFKLRLIAPFYVDYASADVLDFLKKYRAAYGMEPSQYGYGFMGYDLMMLVGQKLLQAGLDLPSTFGEETYRGVGGSFRFGKSTTGKEFENKAISVLEYRDYGVKKIN